MKTRNGEGRPEGFPWLRCLGYGALAAAVGALFYRGVLVLTGYEIGLLALPVGLWVGWVVQRAAGRGGWRAQGLAAGFTYLAIVVTYAPDVAEELQRQAATVDRQAPSAKGERSGGVEATETAESSKRAPREADSGAIQAAGQFVVLVLSVPLLALGQGDLTGALFLVLGMLQAMVMNRRRTPRGSSERKP